ncbi:MAG: sugar ABC transporter substrate-binding protein [Candidatus Nanopelagicales bacterium]
MFPAPQHRRGSLVLLAAASLSLAACGTSSTPAASSSAPSSTSASASASSANPAVAEASKAVEAAKTPDASFQAPSVSAGPVPTGKKVAAVTALNAAPLPYQVATLFVDHAKAVGMSGDVLDGKGTPAGWDAAVRTALNGNAAAIGMSASEPSLIPEAAADAAAKGVKFTTMYGCESPKPAGVTMEVPESRASEGALLADWVIANSPEGASVMMFTNSQFFCLKGEAEAFKAELAKGGPSFTVVEEQEATPADQAGAAAVQKVSAILRKHPDAKYFFVMQADWAPILEQGLKATGRTDVTGLMADYDSNVLELMRQEKNLVAAGQSWDQVAWIGLYAAIAGINGVDVPTFAPTVHLVDSTNMGTSGDPMAPGYDLDAAWKDYLTTG